MVLKVFKVSKVFKETMVLKVQPALRVLVELVRRVFKVQLA